MNPSPVTKKALVLCFFMGLIIIVIQITSMFFDNRTTVVFCDVGQGDAAYIRIRNKVDLLIDAGPDRKVLNCLGKYMPFYDRTVELAIISHPQKDHFGGLSYVLDRYNVEKLLMTQFDNPSQSFRQLKQKITDKHIPTDFPSAGDEIRLLGDRIEFLWPPYVEPQRLESADPNDLSLVFLFQERNIKALFTGDATPRVLNEILRSSSTSEVFSLKPSRFDTTNNEDRTSKVKILKIPHHGSKNGLTKKFLRLADPGVSVISVGKNNSYGHPSREVLEMLKASKTKIRRTDEEGDLVFKLK